MCFDGQTSRLNDIVGGILFIRYVQGCSKNSNAYIVIIVAECVIIAAELRFVH